MGCSTFLAGVFLLGCITFAHCSTTYMVIVMNGYYETKSRIEMRIVGKRGTTSAHVLNPFGNVLGTYQKKIFNVVDPVNAGKLNAVKVYLHSGSRNQPWILNKIVIKTNGVYFSFIHDGSVTPGKWVRIGTKCPLGFDKRSDGVCIDKNECNSNPCSGLAKCRNTIGSYKCECPSGYRLRYGSRTKYCEDINECMGSRHHCDHYCTNTLGSYKCECRGGYKLVYGTSCVDRDECQERADNCDRATTNCYNILDGYSFRCNCKAGYKRVNSTSCEEIFCGSLSHYSKKKASYSPPRCLTEKASKPKDTCTRTCHYGYELNDLRQKTVTCTSEGYWSGWFSTNPCIGIKCARPALIKNGFYIPSGCSDGHRYDSGDCTQYCQNGFRNIGGKSLVCQANGTWTGSPAKCEKIYPDPWINCPFNVYEDLPLGKNTTSIGSEWQLPSSNVKIITHSPASANQFFQFPSGRTKIIWTAVNGDGKSKSCTQTITITDKEDPKIAYCPSRVFQGVYSNNPTFVKFKEPRFTDNVGVVQVSPQYTGGVMVSGRGFFYRNFVAKDKRGNSVMCRLQITTIGYKCSLIPDTKGYSGSVQPFSFPTNSYIKLAISRCPNGTTFFMDLSYGIYSCNESTGIWKPEVSDCVGFFKAKNTSQCSEGFQFNKIRQYCLQCPLGTFGKKVNGNGTCIKCPAGTYQDQRAKTSCKRCPQGSLSLQGDHVCRVPCSRGTFSKDGMRPFCSLCPQGQYQPKQGRTHCLSCLEKDNLFTNTKRGAFLCGDKITPTSPQSNDLLVIERVVSPKVINDTSSDVANVFECYVKDNNYDQVSVEWKIVNNGIPGDFLGSLKHEEISNKAGKTIGSRLILTRARSYNADVDYACEATNHNGVTRKVVSGIPVKP